MLKKLITALPALLLLMTLLPGCTSISNTAYSNRVGDTASDFTLKNLDGNTVMLSSLLGQPVMLNFWDST